MAAALEATGASRDADGVRLEALRDRLVDGLLATVPRSFENGDRGREGRGERHVGFAGVEAEALLVLLDAAGVYAAAGSSCSSGATEPSHVLAAMGLPRDAALVLDPVQPRLRVGGRRRRRRARRGPAMPSRSCVPRVDRA